jgi:hypothetical protein
VPSHRITADAGDAICRWKQAGKSSRDIAAQLAEQFGIQVDQRTISRYVGRVREKPAPKRQETRQEPTPDLADQEPAPEPTLDEIEALERRATRLQQLLARDGSMPIRDMAAINAELRQTFAAIRKARAAKQEQTNVLSAEAQATLARIRKFQAQNQAYPEEPPKDVPIPAATGTDSRR